MTLARTPRPEARSSPLHRERVIRRDHAVAEPAAFAVEPATEPAALGGGGVVQAEVPDAERTELEPDQPAGRDVEGHEIQQHQVVPKLLVAGNPFVVVQQIAAAVKNGPLP